MAGHFWGEDAAMVGARDVLSYVVYFVLFAALATSVFNGPFGSLIQKRVDLREDSVYVSDIVQGMRMFKLTMLITLHTSSL